MTRLLVDATTLIALGTVGELDLLTSFDGRPEVPPAVATEVASEPARTNLVRFLEDADAAMDEEAVPGEEHRRRALDTLGDEEVTGDAVLVARVLEERAADRRVGLISDDRRIRTVADGFGATVTGTVGVVVRAVEEGLPPEDGKALVRRVDADGLHMTGELRERALRLVEEAGE